MALLVKFKDQLFSYCSFFEKGKVDEGSSNAKLWIFFQSSLCKGLFIFHKVNLINNKEK